MDKFGFVLPLAVGAVAVWFWGNREIAMAAWREGQRAATGV